MSSAGHPAKRAPQAFTARATAPAVPSCQMPAPQGTTADRGSRRAWRRRALRARTATWSSSIARTSARPARPASTAARLACLLPREIAARGTTARTVATLRRLLRYSMPATRALAASTSSATLRTPMTRARLATTVLLAAARRCRVRRVPSATRRDWQSQRSACLARLATTVRASGRWSRRTLAPRATSAPAATRRRRIHATRVITVPRIPCATGLLAWNVPASDRAGFLRVLPSRLLL